VQFEFASDTFVKFGEGCLGQISFSRRQRRKFFFWRVANQVIL
jgi:hypothetical protein